jgi:hypothetical protein
LGAYRRDASFSPWRIRRPWWLAARFKPESCLLRYRGTRWQVPHVL